MCVGRSRMHLGYNYSGSDTFTCRHSPAPTRPALHLALLGLTSPYLTLPYHTKPNQTKLYPQYLSPQSGSGSGSALSQGFTTSIIHYSYLCTSIYYVLYAYMCYYNHLAYYLYIWTNYNLSFSPCIILYMCREGYRYYLFISVYDFVNISAEIYQ